MLVRLRAYGLQPSFLNHFDPLRITDDGCRFRTYGLLALQCNITTHVRSTYTQLTLNFHQSESNENESAFFMYVPRSMLLFSFAAGMSAHCKRPARSTYKPVTSGNQCASTYSFQTPYIYCDQRSRRTSIS